MRLAVLTNFFPPHHLGGYELACADVAQGLSARGHEIIVITSTHGVAQPRQEGDIHRVLSIEGDSVRSIPRLLLSLGAALRNRAVARRLICRFAPDAIVVFNVSRLGGLLLDWLHTQPIPVVHDVSDTWLPRVYSNDVWFGRLLRESAQGFRRPLRQLLCAASGPFLPAKPAPLNLMRSYFRSDYLRMFYSSCGLATPGATVLHHALPATTVALASGPATERRGVVFSGRLTPEKGIEPLLRAVTSLGEAAPIEHRRLTLIGLGTQYHSAAWHALAKQASGTWQVEFKGQLPREQAIAEVGKHAAFAFPVLWDEPFSIALLEAMALGLTVVATSTGGSSEILDDDVNCCVVPTGDVGALRSALERVLKDGNLRQRMGQNARATAAQFDFADTLTRIEAHLHKQVATLAHG